MDFQVNSPSEAGRVEQIVSQFLLKASQVILESRIPSLRPRDRGGELSASSRLKKSEKWFNLALGDRPASLENLHILHRNLMDPTVIDVIVVRRGQAGSSRDDLYGGEPLKGIAVETVIERWVIQYENMRVLPAQNSDASVLYKKMYKKAIILLRSLQSMTKLLPAYRIFRHLSSANQSCKYDVMYKVSSFSDPFSREEEQMMKQYRFVPVEGVNGCLCVSVTYRPVLSDFDVEGSTSFPPMIIANYVGSPATDPMRVLPSKEKGFRPTSFPARGAAAAAAAARSPPSVPVLRPHTWSAGIHAATNFQNLPFSGSPPVRRGSFSPGDFSSPPKNIIGQRLHGNRLPSGHYKTSSFEEQLSPPFSPASSPSPPAFLLGHSPSQSRLRPESSPVAIPHPMMNRSPRYLSPNNSDPNRHSLPPLSPRHAKTDPCSQDSPSQSGIRSSSKLGPGESYSGMAGSKVGRDSREDSGHFSGLLSSGSSPRVGFSRSSSRVSFQDDLDECDFSLPFDVDDVDTCDPVSSQGQVNPSSDARRGLDFASPTFSMGRTSQDAAVGALVQMLRTAPPLRQQQDSSYYSAAQSLKPERGAGGKLQLGKTSGFLMPRRAADALEELKSYKDMKDLLLSKSGTRSSTVSDQ
ncbi:hypothetical protein Dimus_028113 [Dionaea muscipula]